MQPRLLKEPLRLVGPALLALQSDDRLVRLVRDGHQPAFAAVVDRYRPDLLRYCAGLVGEQRAEDAVQQAFVNAHRALTERETAVALRPWLYRIAHNAALNTLRGETGGWSLDDPDAADALAQTARSVEGVEAVVVRRERLQHTLTTISDLPRPQRDALLLRELEGRSHVEIGAALGVTAGAARQHLMRARAAVRAAAAAITPYPLLVKVATWMTFTPTGESAVRVAAGAGLGAGVAKVTAGVLATGAIVGGAAGTGALPTAHDTPGAAPVAVGAAAAAHPRRPASARALLLPGATGTRGRERLANVSGMTVRRPVRAPEPEAAAGGRDDEDRATPGRSHDADDGRHGSGSGSSGSDAAGSSSRDDDDRAATTGSHGSGSAGGESRSSGSSEAGADSDDGGSVAADAAGAGSASDGSGPGEPDARSAVLETTPAVSESGGEADTGADD